MSCRRKLYVSISSKNAVLLAVFLLLNSGLSSVVTFADSVSEASTEETLPGITRVAGNNRIETSIETARKLKTELGVASFDNIIIARGDKWPDALAGSYLATVKKAPILLVNEGANASVLAYIQGNLSPEGNIYILGGNLAVSEAVENSLRNYGNVKRLEGGNRYGTNISILEEAISELGENPKLDLVVTTGKNYPDAISASALGRAVLLVGDGISGAQKTFLDKYLGEGSEIYIIGGPSAVSPQVESTLSQYGSPIRIAGTNRYSTSVAVAKTLYSGKDHVGLARGDNFPDAMVGGVLIGEMGAPLLLSCNDSGFEASYSYILGNKNIKAVTIFGGTSALSDDAAAMDKYGTRKTGFLNIGSDRYYAETSGKLKKNTTFTVGSDTYGATSSGKLGKNGWAKTGELTYLFENFKVNNVCTMTKKVMDQKNIKSLMDMYHWSNNLKFVSFAGSIPNWSIKSTNWGTLWFAEYGFRKNEGNCYVKSAVFYMMAKMRGYDVRQIACNYTQHGWVLLKDKGKEYVWDIGYALGLGQYEYSKHPRVYEGRYIYRNNFSEMPLKYKA